MQPLKALSVTIVLCALSLPAMADCSSPTAPARVPDGKSASQQEMIAAMTMLKQYDADVNAYLKCLEFEAKQNRLSSLEENRRHGEAVATLTTTAAKFNEQVRVFKSKSS